MPYYKFGKNDIFRNRIQAHPKVELLTWSGSVYYNNTSQTSSNPNIPNGHINLHEINVNRGGGVDRPDDNLVYPFVTKQGSSTSFKTVTTSNFNTDFNFGDVISGSYPMTATISRDYYQATYARSRIEALRTTLDYYSRLNPHYQYSSSLFHDFGKDELTLVSIPSIFYGSAIKKGTVKLSFYVTGTLIAQAEDQNRDGSLIQTGPIDSIGSGSVAGVILYNEGFLILTGTSAIGIDKSHQEKYIGGGSNSNPKWIHFNSQGDSYDRIVSSSFNLEFEGTNYIPTVTMLAHAPRGALNNSNNFTFVSKGQIQNVQTGTVGSHYKENPNLIIKNIVKSPYNEHTASFEKQTYISKIGIYDKDKNLIAIAKLANPVKKTEDKDYTFKLKLDF